jgi:hypothetical protein
MSEFVKLPLWFNIVALLLFSWPLGACAPKPPIPVCEELQAGMVVLNGSIYTMFSTEQTEKLLERMRNLQNGVCKLPTPEPEGTQT